MLWPQRASFNLWQHCHTEHLEVKQHSWSFSALGWTGCTNGKLHLWGDSQRLPRWSELEETGFWFKYFWFVKHYIFCHLMLHKIFFLSLQAPSSMTLKNQTHHGWYFAFSIATTGSVILGDNNSTEKSSQLFWHRKSYPHVALQCRRQWENISKSLSNITFCRVPQSVSSYCYLFTAVLKKKNIWKKGMLNP